MVSKVLLTFGLILWTFNCKAELPLYMQYGCELKFISVGPLCVNYEYNDFNCFPWDKTACNLIHHHSQNCHDWICEVCN